MAEHYQYELCSYLLSVLPPDHLSIRRAILSYVNQFIEYCDLVNSEGERLFAVHHSVLKQSFDRETLEFLSFFVSRWQRWRRKCFEGRPFFCEMYRVFRDVLEIL